MYMNGSSSALSYLYVLLIGHKSKRWRQKEGFREGRRELYLRLSWCIYSSQHIGERMWRFGRRKLKSSCQDLDLTLFKASPVSFFQWDSAESHLKIPHEFIYPAGYSVLGSRVFCRRSSRPALKSRSLYRYSLWMIYFWRTRCVPPYSNFLTLW